MNVSLVLRMVDSQTSLQHIVRAEDASLHRHSGRYPALCGAEVVAASLSAGASHICRECQSLTVSASGRRKKRAANRRDSNSGSPAVRKLYDQGVRR